MIVRLARRVLPALALGLALAADAQAQAKNLHWSLLDVQARLDADGDLRVVETHAMVFNGDWNGGERIFRLFPGQTLSLESVARIDADGTRHPLSQGGLSSVDEWSWTSPNVLRWRSRLPSDPPFENTQLLYELTYTLHGILQRRGSTYVLDHDFAFPDRQWPIQAFTLSLELDPVWKPEKPFPGTFREGALPPGRGFVVTVPLAYTGTGSPSAAAGVASPRLRLILWIAFFAAVLVLYFAWRSRDGALGRFAPHIPPESIDEEWLSQNLLALSPEEAGALWDEKIGAPEVAAVLARLASEKKISSEAEGKKLKMRLLVPMDRFSGYDHDLVRALFLGRQETDTDAIKAHYKSSGFDPASKIRSGLEAKLKRHPDFQDTSPAPSRWWTPALFAAGFALHLAAVLTKREEPGQLFSMAFVYLLVYGIGAACALAFQKRIEHVDASSAGFLWVPALLLLYAGLGLRDTARVSTLTVLGSLLVRLAVVNGVFNLARTRNGAHRIARRKALASARGYFVHELSRPAPRLKDEWFPYVVAFGLTSEADRWFKAHGGAAAAGSAGAWTGSSSGSSRSSSSEGWTGGGGAFGGAGASGSWAVAAGALAAGVSAPSSSGGGGGGGEAAGGSSGGGGGGGWYPPPPPQKVVLRTALINFFVEEISAKVSMGLPPREPETELAAYGKPAEGRYQVGRGNPA